MAGCTLLRNDYVEPSSGATAAFSVSSASRTTTRLDFYDGYQACTGRRLAAITRDVSPAVRVPAGTPITFTVMTSMPDGVGNSLECVMTGTFTPRAGARYVAESALAGRRCSLVLKTEGGQPVPFRTRKWRSGVTEASSFCSAD